MNKIGKNNAVDNGCYNYSQIFLKYFNYSFVNFGGQVLNSKH